MRMDEVWNVVERDLPVLNKMNIESMLKELDE